MSLNSPLISILRTAHCRSTHHYFAVDALPLVQTDPGRRLVKLLLRHHDRYLTGAKDPDLRFRDFQNHVVHVTDGYWGGAPRVAHQWYDRMQRYLRTNRFSDAAHAAGVLSHYFTDPLQPLHTQHCEREGILHRPIEWSISRSYKTIFRQWKQDDMRIVFQLSDGPGWLGEAILHGARFANHKFWPLLDQYDVLGAMESPQAGLNANLQASVAELFGLAVTGWARVLERAASDAEAIRGTALPAPLPAIATVLAMLRIPARLSQQQIARRHERHAVGELMEEFRQTGTLTQHLPPEVDVIRRVVRIYDNERQWKQQREARLASRETIVDVISTSQSEQVVDQQIRATIPFAPRDATIEKPILNHNLGRLCLTDPLIKAPSIGSKTSARLAAIGVRTVGDLLTASPTETASQLGTYWITAETVVQWKTQATLMCEVPGLRSVEAQLLAGAGYDSADRVASCESTSLHREVSKFATTTAGRRYLRGAAPPSLAAIKTCIHSANQSRSQNPTVRRSA